jgi:hypothetical protein
MDRRDGVRMLIIGDGRLRVFPVASEEVGTESSAKQRGAMRIAHRRWPEHGIRQIHRDVPRLPISRS